MYTTKINDSHLSWSHLLCRLLSVTGGCLWNSRSDVFHFWLPYVHYQSKITQPGISTPLPWWWKRHPVKEISLCVSKTLHSDTRRLFALCFYYDNKTTSAIQRDHVSTKTDRNPRDSPLVVLLYYSLPTSAEDFPLSLVFDILLRVKFIKSKSNQLR